MEKQQELKNNNIPKVTITYDNEGNFECVFSPALTNDESSLRVRFAHLFFETLKEFEA